MNQNIIFWLILIIACESIALYAIKKYSIDNTHSIYLVGSIILYAAIPLFLYKILKNDMGIAIANILWNIASTLYGLLIGVILFNEGITFEQKIGATLGTAGVILIMWDEK